MEPLLVSSAWDPARVVRRALGFPGRGWTLVTRGDMIALARDAGAPLHPADLIALGAAFELLVIAASARGLDLRCDRGHLDERGLFARVVHGTTPEADALRLAACVDRVGTLEGARGGGALAPHVRGRLAAAALHHGAELVWLDEPAALAGLAAVSTAEPSCPRSVPPAEVRAAAMIRVPRPTTALAVAGGRAAQRVWLESVSLRLAADTMLPPHRSADEETGAGRDLIWFALAPAATRSRTP
ncbi:MAG: hypothetical protein K8M05_13255 [Deltaproteobacteria bacterium]|nr:hypothetical protein [Kofleriaceae bacterium]